MHTPDIMNHLICNSMDSWLARRPVLPPEWNGPEEPIQRQTRSAFKAQTKIGWDQFFRGRIAKGMAHTNWHLLQDQTAWGIIHTGSVDANSH
jgi:hypothetical protein